MTLYDEGYSEQSISERVKCSKNAVHNAFVKFWNSGSYSDAERSGRPKKIHNTGRPRHSESSSSVSNEFCKQDSGPYCLQKGADVSRRNVSRRLVNDFDLKSRKPEKITRLTPTMKAKRLAFAQKHVNWTIQQRRRVLFLWQIDSTAVHYR